MQIIDTIHTLIIGIHEKKVTPYLNILILRGFAGFSPLVC